jgi:hypothetical protein
MLIRIWKQNSRKDCSTRRKLDLILFPDQNPKTPMRILFAAIVVAAGALTLKAQQQYDVTVRDGNRLKPGASNAEIRAWMKSQIVESAFAEVMKPASPTAAPLPPAIVQMIKVYEIRRRTLAQILQDHAELKTEADGLYVQYNNIVSQESLKSKDISSLPAAVVQGIILWETQSRTLAHLIQQHPSLKSEVDSMYVQYDGQITQELLKAQQTGR